MSFKAEIQAWIGWNWREGAVDGKGDRHHLPERPGGCFAQMVPVTFSRRRA